MLAQRYPVQSSMHISAPYSVFLSDYTSVGSQKLQMQLFLSDATVSDIDVKFRISIKGEGVEITSNPNFAPHPTIIEGGTMQRLYGEDLHEYFRVENLNLSGISRSQYMLGMALPDGLYTFSIDVLDYHTGRKLANTTSSMGWLILNDIPLLNSPKKSEILRFLSPQNIFFQWTPRHTGSPNSAFTTSYNFELFEVWPEGRSPEEAVRTSTPLYSTTVYSNNLLYGFSEPELLSGKLYVWRVQAVAEGNNDEIELFKNHGYSEVYSFYWGQNCEAVNDVRANKLTHNQMQLEWDANDNHTKFNVEYRPINFSPSQGEMPKAEESEPATSNEQQVWYSQEIMVNTISIRKLPANTEFEVRVLPYCGSFEPEDALIYNFSTTEVPESSYSCGGDVADIVITNQQSIDQLMVGDVVMAGDFPIEIREVENTGGTSTGTGSVAMPVLGGGLLEVTFVNIKVNTDYQLIDGFFRSGSDLESIVGDGSWAIKINLNDKEDNHIVSDKDIVGIRIGPGGEVILIDSEGDEHDTDMDAKGDGGVKITDKDGDIVVVTSGGGILTSDVDTDISEDGDSSESEDGSQEGGETDSSTTVGMTEADYVEFLAAEKQKFGFDTYSHSKIDKHYRTTKILDKTRNISWKSFTAGQTDKVVVNSENKDVNYTTILGKNYTVDKGIININGPPAESVEELYAYVNTKNKKNEEVKLIVGQLNLVGYEQLNRKVVIVPLGQVKHNIIESEVEKELDNIYAQASVDWDVQLLSQPLDISDLELDINYLDASGSLLSTNYSKELRRIINKFKESNDTDDETYYLFIANQATDRNIQGYMRLQSQFGFIFTKNQSPQEISHTIAHELGHGAFYLKHPFSEHNFAEKEEYNLMNYGGGTELWKYQWDWVHDPSSWAMNWVQGDEEGMAFGLIGTEFVCISDNDAIKKINKYKRFFLADGRIIDTEGKYIVSGFFNSNDNSQGAIYSMQVNSHDYIHLHSNKKTRGFGYKDETGNIINTIPIEELLLNDNSTDAVKVIVNKKTNKVSIVKNGSEIETLVLSQPCSCNPPYDNKIKEKECQDFLRIYADSPFVNDKNNYFYRMVHDDPCLLQGLDVYNTSDAQYESQFAKDVEYIFSAALYITIGGVVAAPIIGEAMSIEAVLEAAGFDTAVNAIVKLLSKEKAKDFVNAALAEAGIYLIASEIFNTTIDKKDFVFDVVVAGLKEVLPGAGKFDKAVLGCMQAVELNDLTMIVNDISEGKVNREVLINHFYIVGGPCAIAGAADYFAGSNSSKFVRYIDDSSPSTVFEALYKYTDNQEVLGSFIYNLYQIKKVITKGPDWVLELKSILGTKAGADMFTVLRDKGLNVNALSKANLSKFSNIIGSYGKGKVSDLLSDKIDINRLVNYLHSSNVDASTFNNIAEEIINSKSYIGTITINGKTLSLSEYLSKPIGGDIVVYYEKILDTELIFEYDTVTKELITLTFNKTINTITDLTVRSIINDIKTYMAKVIEEEKKK